MGVRRSSKRGWSNWLRSWGWPGLVLLAACAQSGDQLEVVIDNRAGSCLTLTDPRLDARAEPVVLTAGISVADPAADCECKSALIEYHSSQTVDGRPSELLSGNFSVLNRGQVVLPVAVQRQLIYPELPLQIRLACASY